LLGIGYVGEEVIKLLQCCTTDTKNVYNCNTNQLYQNKHIKLFINYEEVYFVMEEMKN